MFAIKFLYFNQVRRVQISSDSKFEDFCEAAAKLFSSLGKGEISFLWIDDENDAISCSSQVELMEALRIMKKDSQAVLKFEVVKVANAPEKPRIVHDNVTCDVCGVSPICGSRFKCAIRENYDMCETCEAATSSNYPLLKIPSPAQAPVSLFVAMSDTKSAGFECDRHGDWWKRKREMSNEGGQMCGEM